MSVLLQWPWCQRVTTTNAPLFDSLELNPHRTASLLFGFDYYQKEHSCPSSPALVAPGCKLTTSDALPRALSTDSGLKLDGLHSLRHSTRRPNPSGSSV